MSDRLTSPASQWSSSSEISVVKTFHICLVTAFLKDEEIEICRISKGRLFQIVCVRKKKDLFKYLTLRLLVWSWCSMLRLSRWHERSLDWPLKNTKYSGSFRGICSYIILWKRIKSFNLNFSARGSPKQINLYAFP